jgi:hypothetical protein
MLSNGLDATPSRSRRHKYLAANRHLNIFTFLGSAKKSRSL